MKNLPIYIYCLTYSSKHSWEVDSIAFTADVLEFGSEKWGWENNVGQNSQIADLDCGPGNAYL